MNCGAIRAIFALIIDNHEGGVYGRMRRRYGNKSRGGGSLE